MQEEEIKARIAEIADFKNLKEVKLEILNLPHYLDNNETIEAIAKCILDMNDWLILVTNKRVFLSNYILYNQIIDIPKASIQNITLNGGSLYSELIIEQGKSILYLKLLTHASADIYNAILCLMRGTKLEKEARSNHSISKNKKPHSMLQYFFLSALIFYGIYTIICQYCIS